MLELASSNQIRMLRRSRSLSNQGCHTCQKKKKTMTPMSRARVGQELDLDGKTCYFEIRAFFLKKKKKKKKKKKRCIGARKCHL